MPDLNQPRQSMHPPRGRDLLIINEARKRRYDIGTGLTWPKSCSQARRDTIQEEHCGSREFVKKKKNSSGILKKAP